MSIFQDWATLFSPVNRGKEGEETQEGVVAPFLPELELSMADDELLKLKSRWEGAYTKIENGIEQIRKTNEAYWLGKQPFDADFWGDQKPVADNILFEAVETFLPIATRKPAEPIVFAGEDEQGQELADNIRKQLLYLADKDRLKLKMKKAVRYWTLYRLGCLKIGWSRLDDEITCQPIRPQKLILDPAGTWNEGGEFTGDFIGEHREDSAATLIARFPSKKSEILAMVQEELATRVKYIEWWTKQYTFWTVQNIVLGKHKNPHWNYDGKEKRTDENGQVTEVDKRGSNHFMEPKMPYLGISVFNLGLKPFDDTSLIEQNISLQDLVNKRLMQIDRNADNTNSGLRISGDAFTEEQAARVDRALRKGKSIWVPRGDVNGAASRDVAPPLPQFVYQSLQDYRSELRNIFGISASTASGVSSQDTVRGKILAKGTDESRIGGGITEYIEQVYDSVFNWFVQLMFVYYTEDHVSSVLGADGGRQFITLRSSDLEGRRITVSVKEGSLIPEDPLTRRNEAMDLWSAGAIDPVTFYKRLGFPDPQKAAEDLVRWQTNPQSFAQPQEQQMQPSAEQPVVDATQQQSSDLLASIPTA